MDRNYCVCMHQKSYVNLTKIRSKNQGSGKITEKMANKFFCRFWEDRMYMQKETRKRYRRDQLFFTITIIFGQKYVIENRGKNVSYNDCKYRSYEPN